MRYSAGTVAAALSAPESLVALYKEYAIVAKMRRVKKFDQGGTCWCEKATHTYREEQSDENLKRRPCPPGHPRCIFIPQSRIRVRPGSSGIEEHTRPTVSQVRSSLGDGEFLATPSSLLRPRQGIVWLVLL